MSIDIGRAYIQILVSIYLVVPLSNNTCIRYNLRRNTMWISAVGIDTSSTKHKLLDNKFEYGN